MQASTTRAQGAPRGVWRFTSLIFFADEPAPGARFHMAPALRMIGASSAGQRTATMPPTNFTVRAGRSGGGVTPPATLT